MSPARIGVLIVIAVALSTGVALIARSIVSAQERKGPVVVAAPPPKPMVRVLVAGRDLAPGDRLQLSDFAWQPWPADSVNPVFIVDRQVSAPVPSKAPAAVKIETAAMNAAVDKAHEVMISSDGGPGARLVDAIVRQPMLKGEPILEGNVVHAGSAGVMAVELTPGMRAMSVPLSAESAAGGFILPGDHVDVVQSRQVDNGGGAKRFASGTVLRNVKVLAIDQTIGQAQKSAAVVGATATLEVTPAEAELIALAKSEGQLTLILRSYADIGGPSVPGGDSPINRGGERPQSVVRIFRNGAAAEVAVTR